MAKADGKGKRSTEIERKVEMNEQKNSRRTNRHNIDSAEWSSANAEKLLGVISAVARTGAAIRFGYTRDGGAFAIGIVGDGEPYTEYVRPNEDIDLYLDGLLEDFLNTDRP